VELCLTTVVVVDENEVRRGSRERDVKERALQSSTAKTTLTILGCCVAISAHSGSVAVYTFMRHII
jgi:hypothetical protein